MSFLGSLIEAYCRHFAHCAFEIWHSLSCFLFVHYYWFPSYSTFIPFYKVIKAMSFLSSFIFWLLGFGGFSSLFSFPFFSGLFNGMVDCFTISIQLFYFPSPSYGLTFHFVTSDIFHCSYCCYFTS